MKFNFRNIWLKYLVKKNNKLHKSSFKASEITNVLIVELTRLGDVVSILSSIRFLQKNIPNGNFYIAVNEKYKPVVQEFLSDVTVLGFVSTDSYNGLLDITNTLRKYSFDIALSMSPSYRNAVVSLALKSKFKAGYFEPKQTVTPFLHKNEIASFGFEEFNTSFYYYENIYRRSSKICEALGFDGEIKSQFLSNNLHEKKYIVIHPYSGWKYRSWAEKNFIELAKKLLASTNYNIIFIGSHEENINNDEITQFVKGENRITKLFGNGLTQIIGTLKNSVLFIGNDSGPLHLATALGIPSIGLFGPAPPNLTAPISEINYYFHEKVECCPCEQIECIKSDNPCMNLINVDAVFNKAIKMIED